MIGAINLVGREGKDLSFGVREEAINFSAISAISANDLGDLDGRFRQTILAIEALDDLGELGFPCGVVGHEQRLSLSLSLSSKNGLKVK